MYLQADIEAFDIRELTPKFDVILLEPPLEEYYRETGITANEKCWTWDDIMKLEIDEIAAPRLFIFLWFWGGTGPWKSDAFQKLRKWKHTVCFYRFYQSGVTEDVKILVGLKPIKTRLRGED